MSKGNLFLGMATGKIGSVVLYRAFGEERARSWVASKKNPRTWRQGLQRCFMKTAQIAYSALLPLCRDSMQGYQAGTPSQAAFVSRNVRLLRARVADDIIAGRSACLESAAGCYNGRADELMLANPLMVSDGSLGTIGAAVSAGSLSVGTSIPSSPTYAQVCAALGLQKSDVLRLLFLEFTSGVLTSVHLGRLVLAPSGGDMSADFLADGSINEPNEDNTGIFTATVEDGALLFSTTFAANAGAVVLSRQFVSVTQYSAEFLTLGDDVAQGFPLGLALASYLEGGSVYLDGF